MYVSEVACCASVTLACLLNIINVLSLLCCKTDYLFCYISINVILLLKAHGVSHCFLQRIIFFLALLMCGRGLQELRHTTSNTSAVVLFVALTLCTEPRCRHDSPAPASTHNSLLLDFQTDTRENHKV